MRSSYLFISIVILASSLSWAQLSIEDELSFSVMGIEGKSHTERNEFIKKQLRVIGAGYVTAPFTHVVVTKGDTAIIKGENIIVRTGGGAKQIVIGAHYDAFGNSPGANDNGSGVAVLLSLIKHLQDVEWNYSIDFCFFDQEEKEYLGSYYYIKQFVVPKRHFAMINLDVEGTGEEVFVGPIGKNNQTFLRYVHETAQKTGFPFFESADFPATDHESFTRFNLQNISISIVPKGDGERLSKYVKNGYKADSLDTPKTMSTIHTFEDRSKYVSNASLKMSYEFTKTLLMLLNESGR
jgi:Zn-dependent M28 family amino/carboxypeptidase